MKPILIAFLILSLSAGRLSAQKNTASPAFYHPDSVKAEFIDLFQELRIKHPGFYRYQNAQAYDAYLDSIVNTIQEPLSELEVYRRLKPAIAKMGCLHTGISLSEKTEKELNEEANCFPLGLYAYKGEVYVWQNHGKNTAIQLGSKVLEINGRSIKDIYQQLLSNIPMDGYNTTGKYRLLQFTFPLWYRGIIEVTLTFELLLEEKGKSRLYTLKGIKQDQIPRYEEVVNEDLQFEIHDEVARFKIPSFSQSYYKGRSQNFRQEIKNGFKACKQAGVKYLIVDLRGNTGGSDSHAVFFTSHLFEETFRYWDRIEVTEGIAKEVKGFNRVFYSKPRLEDSTWRWKKSAIFTREFDYYEAQKPANGHFDGEVIVLIDGLCMSSCSDVAAILSFNDRARFIGEETGGGFQGNNSGMIPETQLSTGINISVPLLGYYNAVDPDMYVGRGTLPEHPCMISPKDLIDERDSVLARAYQLIEEGRQAYP